MERRLLHVIKRFTEAGIVVQQIIEGVSDDPNRTATQRLQEECLLALEVILMMEPPKDESQAVKEIADIRSLWSSEEDSEEALGPLARC